MAYRIPDLQADQEIRKFHLSLFLLFFSKSPAQGDEKTDQYTHEKSHQPHEWRSFAAFSALLTFT